MTVLLEGQSLICHSFPRPQPSPPLSTQVSSNGRDNRRTFLRIDGVTEVVRPGSSCSPEFPPYPELGLRDPGRHLPKAPLPKGQLQGHTHKDPSRGSVRRGELSGRQRCCGLGKVSGRGSREAPQELPLRAGLSMATGFGSAWAPGGPTWSFPIPSHFLLLPTSKSQSSSLLRAPQDP